MSVEAEHILDEVTRGGTERYVLSGATRAAYENGIELLLNTGTLPELVASSRPPRTLLEGIDRLVLYIGRKATDAAEYVRLNQQRDYPILCVRDGSVFRVYIEKARTLNYIEWNGDAARLDLRGWERFSELDRVRPLSNQAFVAMWFDPLMNSLWTDGMVPAFEGSQFRPFRVDRVEHDEKIDDLIIAEIRRSGLLVADFTGQRGGVYFESGFAMGLGIPVIRMCREDEISKVHFDTRQYNHIVWTTPTDAREKLRLRLAARFPKS